MPRPKQTKPTDYKSLKKKIAELERLVEVISKGKYQWQATFDAIKEPVEIVSSGYIIERANIGLAEVAGKKITEIPSKRCYEAFAGRKAVCDGCPLKAAIAKNSPKSAELVSPIAGRQFVAHAYPYMKYKPDTVVMYYRDITEEKRLYQELIQQEKMAAIGILAGGIAHEINNPLGGILAFTQLLMKDAKDNDLLLKDLKEIENAAVRCKNIVSDLLDFSRVSKEREKCLVDVNMLLNKVFPFLKRDFQSLNIEMDFKAGKNIPQVLGNPDRLQQVFLNILTNACHAMTKGGKITVKTSSDSMKGVCISVKDEGYGIASENIGRIFEPFFTTKAASKGTGLGLSIAYRIIKEHGGKIEVKSGLGQGTTFVILLPAA